LRDLPMVRCVVGSPALSDLPYLTGAAFMLYGAAMSNHEGGSPMTNPRAALTDRLGSASMMRRAAASGELEDVVRIDSAGRIHEYRRVEVLSDHPSCSGHSARVRVHGDDGTVTERKSFPNTSGGSWLWGVQPSAHEP